jgi:hypothetical protein
VASRGRLFFTTQFSFLSTPAGPQGYQPAAIYNSAVVSHQASTTIAAATQIYLRYDGEIASGTDNHLRFYCCAPTIASAVFMQPRSITSF